MARFFRGFWVGDAQRNGTGDEDKVDNGPGRAGHALGFQQNCGNCIALNQRSSRLHISKSTGRGYRGAARIGSDPIDQGERETRLILVQR
jgi:hypothetical protein